MKKSLSVVLSSALVLSMFGAVAANADEMTAQQKFDALKDKGIFAGINANGDAGLSQTMTRAEFARVAGLLDGLNVDATPTSQTFKDVAPGNWAYEEVEAAAKAGLIKGYGNGIYNPKGQVKVEDMAIVLDKILGLKVDDSATVDGADAYAQAYVKAAIDAGILSADANFKAAATREQLVDSSYGTYEQAQAPATLSATASQTGAKTITVNFNRAVTDAEKADLTFSLANGPVPYSVTATWSDDMKSVALAANFLPAGTYTLTVKGLDPIQVTTVDEKVSKIEIGAPNLQVAANQDLQVKAYNQFNEVVANALNDSNISVYNGTTLVSVSGGKVDLSGAKVGDTVVVTAINPTTGVSATKTYTLVAAATVTKMQFGPVAPLKDQTRITVGDTGLAVPYSLIDQYGNKVTLPTGTATAVGSVSGNVKQSVIGDVYFTSNNYNVVDPTSLVVDADGNLTLSAGTTAGTAIITATNFKSGASTTFSVDVQDTAKIKTFSLNNPGVLVAANETVKIPFQAVDQYGKPYTTADFAKSAVNSQVTFTTGSGGSITPKWDGATGELSFNFPTSGTTTLYAWVNGALVSQVTLDVKAQASLTKITAVHDLQTLFTTGGKVTVTGKDNLTIVDNYGRTKSLTDLTGGTYDFTIVKKSGDNVVNIAGQSLTGTGTAGTEVLTLTLTNGGTAIANSSIDITVKGIATADVASFAIDTIGTVYAPSAPDAHYNVNISISGKDASDNKVAIDPTQFITAVTSSDVNVVSATYASGNYTLTGKKAGTATISIWKGATKVADQTVTVSDVAPYAATVTVGDYNAATLSDVSTVLTVKDQYGVAYASAVGQGTFSSSNTSVATVDPTSGVVSFSATGGTVTISYVTKTGVVATVQLTH